MTTRIMHLTFDMRIGGTEQVIKNLIEGSNKIEIVLTTTLANYCMSLDDNPAAKRWTNSYKFPFSSGLVGVAFSK